MGLKSSVLDHLYENSEALFKQLSESENIRTVLYYAGNLSAGFATALSNRLERLLDKELESKQTLRRFFSVFIEALQNIRIHGCHDDDDHVHAGVIIYIEGEKINAKFFNIVSHAQARLLERRYEEVNNASRNDLKTRYLELMRFGDISEKGGAGLGIITIVLRSRNPSEIRFIPINLEYKIFESNVVVDIGMD